jgi:hypothetical protein
MTNIKISAQLIMKKLYYIYVKFMILIYFLLKMMNSKIGTVWKRKYIIQNCKY